MTIDAEYQECEPGLDAMTSAEFLDQIIKLWEGLAAELTCIIGDRGFRVLFARSVCLANEKFSWLGNFRFPLQDESPMHYFSVCFAGRHIDEMRNANALIVSSYIEILSSLVGQTLTTNLLHPKWEQHRLGRIDETGRVLNRDRLAASK